MAHVIDIWLIKYSTVLKKFWRNQFSLALPTAKPKKSGLLKMVIIFDKPSTQSQVSLCKKKGILWSKIETRNRGCLPRKIM